MSMTIGKEAREAIDSALSGLGNVSLSFREIRRVLDRCTDAPEVGLQEGKADGGTQSKTQGE